MEGIDYFMDVRFLERLNARIERQDLVIDDRIDRDAVDIVPGVEGMSLYIVGRGAKVKGPTVEQHHSDIDALVPRGHDIFAEAVKVGFVERLEIELRLAILRISWSGSGPWLRGHTQMIAASGGLRLELFPAPKPDEVVTVLLEELKICIVANLLRSLA